MIQDYRASWIVMMNKLYFVGLSHDPEKLGYIFDKLPERANVFHSLEAARAVAEIFEGQVIKIA